VGHGELTSFKLLMQAIVAFIVVLFLLLLFLKWVGRWNRRQQNSSLLRTLGWLHVDQKHAVCLIEAAGKFYLIGVGEDVRLLACIEDKEQIGLIRAFQTEQPGQNHFSHLLKVRLSEVLEKKQNAHDELFADRQGRDKDA
jgi:flagellar protein FliO/FliZ